jgi:hypothetical protein
MKLDIKGKAFQEVYESTRIRWGLPEGEHARVMRHAAVCMVSAGARKRGHYHVQVQGMALECARCGDSCAIDPTDWEVLGALATEKCA